MKKIAQLDKKTKQVIRLWDHYTEPVEFYNLCKTAVYKSLKRENNTTCDTEWVYYNPNFHKVFSSQTYYALFKGNKYYKTYTSIVRIGNEIGMSNEDVIDIMENKSHNFYTIKKIN